MASRSGSLADFGYNLRDWLHELRRVTTRSGLRQTCWHRPPRLAGAVAGGGIADAFLAAQVEYVLHRAGMEPPRWVFDPCYQSLRKFVRDFLVTEATEDAQRTRRQKNRGLTQ